VSAPHRIEIGGTATDVEAFGSLVRLAIETSRDCIQVLVSKDQATGWARDQPVRVTIEPAGEVADSADALRVELEARLAEASANGNRWRVEADRERGRAEAAEQEVRALHERLDAASVPLNNDFARLGDPETPSDPRELVTVCVGELMGYHRAAKQLGAKEEQGACIADLAKVAKCDFPTGGVVENVVALVLDAAISRIRTRGKP
jgi:hypothetical protein